MALFYSIALAQATSGEYLAISPRCNPVCAGTEDAAVLESLERRQDI
jgi:hypothetical protein